MKTNIVANLAYEKEITFSLDVLGKVAYVDELSSDVPNYAYIIGVQQDTDFGDDVLKLKLFTQAGEFAVHELSSKAKIDGHSFNNAAEAITLLNTRPDGTVSTPADGAKVISRPAIVEINSDNMIKEIDTDALNYGEQENKLEEGRRFPKIEIYFPSIKTFDGSFYLTENTVILKVPDIDRYGLTADVINSQGNTSYSIDSNFIKDHEQDVNDIKYYGCWKPGQLQGTMQYDAQAYDVDPDTGIAGLLVVRGMVNYHYQDQNYKLPFNVFKKLSKMIDAETGEEMYKIYYFNSGAEKSVIVDPNELIVWYNSIIFGEGVIDGRTQYTKASSDKIEGLKEGDIFRFEQKNGKLSHIERTINISKTNSVTTGTLIPSAPRQPYTKATVTAGNVPIPFDGRGNVAYTYDQTFTAFFGTAMDMKNGMVELRLPMTTHTNYIGKESQCKVLDRLQKLPAKITVIEETECDVAHDNCKYKIRNGSINDVITASSFSGDKNIDGFYKASKIYLFGTKGAAYTDCIILNLTEEHNRNAK